MPTFTLGQVGAVIMFQFLGTVCLVVWLRTWFQRWFRGKIESERGPNLGDLEKAGQRLQRRTTTGDSIEWGIICGGGVLTGRAWGEDGVPVFGINFQVKGRAEDIEGFLREMIERLDNAT